jgi:hypothetical protein
MPFTTRALLAALLALACAAPLAQAGPRQRFFLSPSHNISCEIDVGQVGVADEAYCQTMQPLASATLTANGKVRACHGTRCIGNPPEHDSTLAYGRSVSLGQFRCTSRVSGVTCLGRTGGFTISRSGISSQR